MSMANTGPSPQSTSRDVVDLLLSQHDQVRTLFGQIGTAAGTTATGTGRRESFDRLVNLLAVHETAEEMVVYPTVRDSGPDGERIADARTAEESEAKHALAELERTDIDSAEFATRLQAFQRLVETHAGNEEREVFPLLRETQTPEQLRKMAEYVERAERAAPTHPHPHGPESATGNLLVGPFVGIVDRVRDALRDRAG